MAALARSSGVESLLFRDGHISQSVPVSIPTPNHPNPRKKEMTLRQITGVYLPRSENVPSQSSSSSASYSSCSSHSSSPPLPAVLCLYHGTRGQQCDQGAFQNTCM